MWRSGAAPSAPDWADKSITLISLSQEALHRSMSGWACRAQPLGQEARDTEFCRDVDCRRDPKPADQTNDLARTVSICVGFHRHPPLVERLLRRSCTVGTCDLGPLLGLFGEHVGVFRGTGAARDIAKISEPLTHLRLAQYHVYVGCDAFTQRGVQVLWSEEPEAAGNGESWIALLYHGGNLRHARRPAVARNSQEFHLPGTRLAEQNRKGHDRNLNASLDQFRDGSDGIAVGDEGKIDPGALLKIQKRQIGRTRHRGVIQRAGLVPG